MESLVDDVNALVAPDLSTDGSDWCDNCQALRKLLPLEKELETKQAFEDIMEIRRLQEEQGQNFGKLKQKIISTDMLIKKYKAKCEDYDVLSKKVEEANKKTDKHIRQNAILETQLKAALLDVDPLRKSKLALETEVQEQRVKIQDLTDKVVAFEGTQRQYEYLNRTTSADMEKLDTEKKELMQKLKTMEAGKISKEAAKEYKYEISTLKKENQKLSKNEKRLDTKLKSALLKIESLSQALKDAKFSPVRRKRTSSNHSLLSPTRSPAKRSPRGRGHSPIKPSPSRSPRTRTVSGRETNFIPKEDEPDVMEDSDSSSEDQGSVYSMSFMFSPLVKCLSPLPPSPVCYGHKLESGDDSSLSDMADELEQQLAETLTEEEKPIETFQEIPDNSKRDLDKENMESVAITDGKASDNDNGAQLFDLNDYEEQSEDVGQESLNSEDVDVDLSNVNMTDSDNQHDCRPNITEKTGIEKIYNTHSSPTRFLNDGSNQNLDSFEKKETVDIISECSTTVLESQPRGIENTHIAQNPKCQNHMIKPDTHDTKSTDVLKMADEITKDMIDKIVNEIETNVEDTPDNKSKDLPRADTSEFIPVMGESAERLSDSESETVNIDTKCEAVVSLPTCTGDASSGNIETAVDDEGDIQEIDLEIEEQTEQVEMQYPPTRGMLKRQRNISSESSQLKGDKVIINEQKSGKNSDTDLDNVFGPAVSRKRKGKKNKSKCNRNRNSFIAFKKSTSGTLAEEIEDMGNDVEYECNDRSNIPAQDAVVHAVNNKEYLKIKDKKLVHKRRYKDLDNFKDESSVDIFLSQDNFKNKKRTIEAMTGNNTNGPNVSENSISKEQLIDVKGDQVKILKDNILETQKTDEEIENSDLKDKDSAHAQTIKEKQEMATGICEIKLKPEEIADNVNTQEQDLKTDIKDSEKSEHKSSEQQDSLETKLSCCSNDLCDTEIQNTLNTVKTNILNADDDSIDASKSQPSRQLSTGFVVGSPYTDSLMHRKTPSEKDRHFQVKTKDTDIVHHSSDHGLEQIEEEGDSEIANDEESVDDSDKVSVDKSCSGIVQPGCSYHYNESSKDIKIDDIDSSISLSQEIRRILDKKPGTGVSRIISCTPDMLDSGSAEFLIDNNSRSITPSEESVSRSPLSPLPISPFDFICPISPLPPSPLREIERVSPLSPDEFEGVDEHSADKSDSHEERIQDFNNEDEACVIENLGYENIRSKILSIEALSLPVPDALSPIKSPNRKLCNKKIKKGKSSAFQPVCKDTGKSLSDNTKKDVNDQVEHLDEQITNTDHIKENMHDHSNKSQNSTGIQKKKKGTRRKSKDSSNKMLLITDMIDTHDVISGAPNSSIDNTQGSVRLKTQPRKILSGKVDKGKTTKEENEKGSIEDSDMVNVVKEEEKTAETPDISSGQDNLAFKKKTRLAHRPNIQALRPSKVQVLDIQALPPLNRKRRSLETADTEGKDKKQCKGTTFHKDRNSAASKEESKRMQIFLKSYESPDSFVTRVMETDKGDALVERILNHCIECLGRVRTDTVEIVYNQCENEAYKMLDLQWPFLSDVEKQATKLLQYLYTQDSLNVSYQSVMTRLWECIFGRNLSINVVGQMCYCRVFTALSSLQGDVEQARVLFCNIVSCGHLNVRQFVVPVVSVWPEVLMKGETDYGLLTVLEEVVTKALMDQSLDVNKKILVILQKLCGWSGRCGQAESMLYSLLSKLEDTCKQQSETQGCYHEVTKAIHLLSVCGGWAWFKEFFVLRHGLQSVANKCKAKNTTKTIPPAYVCAVLKITGSVISTLSETVPVKDMEQCTRNWMLPLLKADSVDQSIKQCCVEVLLELSPFLPSLLKGIKSWYVSQPPSVKKQHCGVLEAVRKLYKHRLGFSCDPFI